MPYGLIGRELFHQLLFILLPPNLTFDELFDILGSVGTPVMMCTRTGVPVSRTGVPLLMIVRTFRGRPGLVVGCLRNVAHDGLLPLR